MELEFSVDPLFKKASADFDEGGAKGLLLNHLATDASGRIVFDSSDDAGDAIAGPDNERRQSCPLDDENAEYSVAEEPESLGGRQELQNYIDALGSRFFPDLSTLDEQDICPSLKSFDLGDSSGSLDIPFLKAPEDWRQEKDEPPPEGQVEKSGIFLDDYNAAGFDDDDGVLAGFDVGADAGFGEGGEVWAKDAAIEPQMRPHGEEYGVGGVGAEEAGDGMGIGGFDPEGGQYAVSLQHRRTDAGHEDILSYFDNALHKNWAGPEHWKIRRIKDSAKAAGPAPAKRKEKEPFQINFTASLDPALAELIYTPASSNTVITLPKTQWRSKTKNLLPDDKHFNSRQLLRLFIKPAARIGSRRPGSSNAHGRARAKREETPDGEMDEAFWARKENNASQLLPEPEHPQGNYDANFFQDDGLPMPGGLGEDDDEFADAREAFSPDLEGNPASNPPGIAEVMAHGDGNHEVGAFGTQLVTQSRRMRPEYVQYARVAKKVDVRRLKEEMWRGIGFDQVCKPFIPFESPFSNRHVGSSYFKRINPYGSRTEEGT
jgi:condensin complex subunit 2